MHTNSNHSSQPPRTQLPVHGLYLQNMITEVGQDVGAFLQYLTNKYLDFGIDFDVVPLKQVVMRMLVPFEVLGRYGMADYSGLFVSDNQQRSVIKPNSNQPQPQRQGTQFGVPSLRKQQKNNQSLSNVQKQQRQKLHIHKTSTRYKGGKPILNEEMEQRVRAFIYEEVKKGKILLMRDIALYAKKICKDKDFLGSIGWVKNFMKRYPEMRKMYDAARQGQSIELESVDNKSQFVRLVIREQQRYKNSIYNEDYDDTIPHPFKIKNFGNFSEKSQVKQKGYPEDKKQDQFFRNFQRDAEGSFSEFYAENVSLDSQANFSRNQLGNNPRDSSSKYPINIQESNQNFLQIQENDKKQQKNDRKFFKIGYQRIEAEQGEQMNQHISLDSFGEKSRNFNKNSGYQVQYKKNQARIEQERNSRRDFVICDDDENQEQYQENYHDENQSKFISEQK